MFHFDWLLGLVMLAGYAFLGFATAGVVTAREEDQSTTQEEFITLVLGDEFITICLLWPFVWAVFAVYGAVRVLLWALTGGVGRGVLSLPGAIVRGIVLFTKRLRDIWCGRSPTNPLPAPPRQRPGSSEPATRNPKRSSPSTPRLPIRERFGRRSR